MAFAKAPPTGFPGAVDFVNTLPPAVVEDLAGQVMAFLQYKTGVLSPDKAQASLLNAGRAVELAQVQSALNVILFLFRGFVREECDLPTVGQVLKNQTRLNSDNVVALGKVWKSEHGKINRELQKLLLVGRLVDLQWKLGVAYESSACKALSAPYVSMVLRVADPNGRVETHAIELTLAQFQAFAQNLRDISEALGQH